jgi:hypothetical protein
MLFLCEPGAGVERRNEPLEAFAWRALRRRTIHAGSLHGHLFRGDHRTRAIDANASEIYAPKRPGIASRLSAPAGQGRAGTLLEQCSRREIMIECYIRF